MSILNMLSIESRREKRRSYAMTKKTVAMIIVGVLAAIGFFILAQRPSGFTSITTTQVKEMVSEDTSVVLLDVRTPAEYNSETGHLAHAKLIPVQELEQRIEELTPFRGKTIVTYCRSGHRSSSAASLLTKRGFKVINMEGGILKWNQEHLPVVKEQTE
jgi:rhodanese-related sulfurtransferase